MNFTHYVIIVLCVAIGVLIAKLIKQSDKLSESKHTVFVLKRQLEEKQSENLRMETVIGELTKINKNTPEDCKRGPWCTACAYDKKLSKYISLHKASVHTSYCGKAEACEHFQPTKQEDDKNDLL